MFIVLPHVSGAMFIQGGTFIPNSRVEKRKDKITSFLQDFLIPIIRLPIVTYNKYVAVIV